MATTNGSTAIRDKILASLARYRALRIGKFPCAFWRLSARPGLTAAVESAINALQGHGLSQCRDHGIDGFERYTALAILYFATRELIKHCKDIPVIIAF
ncbi:hypothetical protein [Bathymodiolus japonicus methanotrophic gill symbiont]|uniref:hypothetical protein n=1 Tax=Bathymodiolus japonicus methanotrophic gill symbiont TaxID=113269 RepID=UPI001C8D9E06|nr:hypothetical protein [Bathymodiolus japonicus methanotrophic gill symbiont]